MGYRPWAWAWLAIAAWLAVAATELAGLGWPWGPL